MPKETNFRFLTQDTENKTNFFHLKTQYGRLYDLRHTAITNMYLKALPDQVIRKMVGWSPSSRMSDVYVHVQEAHLKQAFSAVFSQERLPHHKFNPNLPRKKNSITQFGFRAKI
ncbi:MAG: hypothetical protein ACTSYY_03430 [Promethearchaeota archaeon]